MSQSLTRLSQLPVANETISEVLTASAAILLSGLMYVAVALTF